MKITFIHVSLVTEIEELSNRQTDEDEYENQMRNDEHGRHYRDVYLNLAGSAPNNTNSLSGSNTTENTRWWSLSEVCNSSETFYSKVLELIPFADCSGYVMYFFNDKIFPAKLNFISGSG